MKLNLLMALLCVLSTHASAAQQRPETKDMKMPETKETQIWLQIQRENMMATSYQDTLSPEAAKASQQRAIKTFSHELPDKFIKSEFGEK
ncbi:DUF3613 domain-containing protein [Vibrio fluvialis]|uniref:DUF3613 domain-containing protein n=1 Tax=Vibrio fluvialis TaxID=676 RepID=UPI001ABE01CC|nr:DUF3613 domain-containing protein [Vibrio fluvialis]EKO3402015.1 DUF3613 domain-containing protein [Vibrio fluvialis]ELG2041885.1 DUF3613 domain-containing protein [Vibrio fluvialis]MBY7768289.1 DUF3613 domain-containing protein [Vibrio fluvialis]MBY8044722.1 DUF3613 domain-containing protein [Vibrio fluvialis]MBY8053300.1 DUF3613 domain-containing protein [Vibrio fluvialis]